MEWVTPVLPEHRYVAMNGFTVYCRACNLNFMSTITAILEPEADGSLRLPLPPELRHGKVRIEARLESVGAQGGSPQFGCLAGKIWLAPDFDEPLEDFKEYSE